MNSNLFGKPPKGMSIQKERGAGFFIINLNFKNEMVIRYLLLFSITISL